MFNVSTILRGLGLVPAESRSVKAMPSELKGLVPAPVDNNITVKASTPDVESDTMPLIVSKAKRTAYQTKKLAAKLKGVTLADTLHNDSNFILDYIKYRKDDEAHEQVRSPRRLVYDGHGDCDCFAVFLATLLINQGIDFRFRITKYKEGDEWAHIYLVVPKNQRHATALDFSDRSKYYVLDPVANQHDHEVNFVAKKDYNMALQYLDGLPSTGSLSGLGCECGVKSNGNGNDHKPDSYVVPSKTLEYRGLISAPRLLEKLGLPFNEKINPDGTIYYDVTTPSGVKQVAPFVPVDPDKQQTIINDLMQPATVQASTENILSPTSGKLAAGVLGALALFSWGISKVRNDRSANALGSLPKKRLPVVQM